MIIPVVFSKRPSLNVVADRYKNAAKVNDIREELV